MPRFNDKWIMYFFVSLYVIVGVNLSLIVCNVAVTMTYSYEYILFSPQWLNRSGYKKFVGIIVVFVSICVTVYSIVTTVVYFLIKKTDVLSAVIFSLLIVGLLGKFVLSTVYAGVVSGDFKNETLHQMSNDMSKADADNSAWTQFQIDMKCCGVYEPNDYSKIRPDDSLPSSCCGYNKHSYRSNCSKTDSYQIGCHTKLIVYFEEYNQLIIWTGIGYDVFTMLVLFLLRHSKMFVVVGPKSDATVFVVDSYSVH